MKTQRIKANESTAISGWFRITVVVIAACPFLATYADGEGFLDRFSQYFVGVVLSIAAIRLIFYVADWVTRGFADAQAQKLVRQGKFLLGILACAVFLYLTLPLYRYSVIAAPNSDSTGSPTHFVLLDRVSGEVLWLGRVNDRQKPRPDPI